MIKSVIHQDSKLMEDTTNLKGIEYELQRKMDI